MAKLVQQRAYFLDGTIKTYKTNRKNAIKTDGLLGLVSFYDDGTRVQEDLVLEIPRSMAKGSAGAANMSQIKADLEHKSDGGPSLETLAFRKGNRE